MKGFNKKYTSGFTLVELLVVIAIIALLLSILMPSLNKAREQAKKMQCAAHLYGMAMAMHMYAMTYKEIFPAMLMPGNLSKAFAGKSHWHQLAMEFAPNKKQLRCPSLNTKRLIRWDDGTFLTGFGLNYNGWNWKYSYSWTSEDPDGGFGYVIPEEPRGGCIKSTRGRQSEFIMLGDSNGNKQTDFLTLRSNYTYGIVGPPRVLGKVNTQGDMPDVHSKGGNIAFMDTHVQWYQTTELMSDKMLYMWQRGKN